MSISYIELVDYLAIATEVTGLDANTLTHVAKIDKLAASQPAIPTPAAVQRLRTQPAAPGAPPAAALQLSTAAAPSQPKERPDTTIYVHPVPVEREGRLLLYLDYWWYLSDNRYESAVGPCAAQVS